MGKVGVYFYLCLPCMQFPKQFPKTWKINRNSGRLLIRNCFVVFRCFGVLHGNFHSKRNSGLFGMIKQNTYLFVNKVKTQHL